MSIKIIATLLISSFIFVLSVYKKESKPNVILIMADDMGYECLGVNGSLSYETPVLDQLAEEGIRFTNCYSQPLCTPSRVKIMTGKYNYRNYDHFGYLNENEMTFGSLMKEAGYSTAIVGKWQLNGLAYDLPGYNDNVRPRLFGFDEFCLWQLTVPGNKGSRYAQPVIEQNGELLNYDIDSYGPDIFVDYIVDFIKRKRKEPFFIYYPMVLVHDPFVPTPDSEEWDNEELRLRGNKDYFADMVAYTDKSVGRILEALRESSVEDNTIVMFTGDNGTGRAITSETSWGTVKGFKGNTTDAGTRVPFIVRWPRGGRVTGTYDGLVDFSDFFATISDLTGSDADSDGQSLMPIFRGDKSIEKEKIFIHYDPRWNNNVNIYRNQFARTKEYKLYRDGKFYSVVDDVLETQPIPDSNLTKEQMVLKMMLQSALDEAPPMVDNE